MLSSHLFLCLPLILVPLLPLAELSWPCQGLFRYALLHYGKKIVVFASWILIRTSSFVTWLCTYVSDVQKHSIHRISRACILLSSPAVRVQLSHAYRKVDKMRVRANLALEAREMLLFLISSFKCKFPLCDVTPRIPRFSLVPCSQFI